MNVSRIAILGVALVAGVAAFFLMMNNGPSDAPVQIVEPVKEETVRVLVSGRDMQRGERVAIDDTNWITWPKAALQPHFITDETPERREEIENAVVRSLIVAGEPFVDAKIVKAGSSGLMAAILSPGMRAVTMRVSAETSSGGFILPGDRVDIHYTEASEDSGNTTKIFPIQSNVRVLAVDTIFSENPETPNINGSNVTMEMTPDDAEYFMIARNSKGKLQLTLRSIFEPEEEVEQKRRVTEDVIVIRYGRS
ncbi:MAG: Flp pilus assembly protein CpaB [Pseudomonadota bacterium]